MDPSAIGIFGFWEDLIPRFEPEYPGVEPPRLHLEVVHSSLERCSLWCELPPCHLVGPLDAHLLSPLRLCPLLLVHPMSNLSPEKYFWPSIFVEHLLIVFFSNYCRLYV